MADDPLGIIMVCSGDCGYPFNFQRHMERRCDGIPTAYIPVENIPHETIEELRAEHLEINTPDGPKRLADIDLPDSEVAEVDPAPADIPPEDRNPEEPDFEAIVEPPVDEDLAAEERAARQELGEGW